MRKTALCGLNCADCGNTDCPGCTETGGRPFGGSCVLGECCRKAGCESCGKAFEAPCRLKEALIAAFNALGIPDMDPVTDLTALMGSYVNLEYPLPGGQKVKFWDDSRVYLGNQLHKKGTDRCYGLLADENYLLVCEYGCNGADPEIIVYKRWNLPFAVESRCGLSCTGCGYRESCGCGGCIETMGHPFHGECPVAKCCQEKGFVHCGECPELPCALLTQYSNDPEHGDTPPGARIDQCRRWREGRLS